MYQRQSLQRHIRISHPEDFRKRNVCKKQKSSLRSSDCNDLQPLPPLPPPAVSTLPEPVVPSSNSHLKRAHSSSSESSSSEEAQESSDDTVVGDSDSGTERVVEDEETLSNSSIPLIDFDENYETPSIENWLYCFQHSYLLLDEYFIGILKVVWEAKIIYKLPKEAINRLAVDMLKALRHFEEFQEKIRVYIEVLESDVLQKMFYESFLRLDLTAPAIELAILQKENQPDY